jgi:hypothetical protein
MSSLFIVEGKYQSGLDQIHDLYLRYPSDINIILGYVVMLHTIGEFDKAVLLGRKLVSLDPLSPFIHRQLGEQLFLADQLKEARVEAMQAEVLGLDVAPLLTWISMREKNYVEANEHLQRDWGSEGNYFTVRGARGTAGDHKHFPNWFAHPRYHQIMTDTGLDDASVAKLKLRPLDL